MADTQDNYGAGQKLLHWLVALLVVGQVVLGVWLNSLDPHDQSAAAMALATKLFQAHDGTGAAILVLVLVRLLVRLTVGVPALPRGTPRWVDSLAHLNHRLLYLVLIVQPVLGYLTNGANGFPWSIYGYYDVPAIIAKNAVWADWLGQAHQVGATVLIALIALHLLGAFYHGVIRRDGVVRRIV
jgi:cytochrome b561